MIEWFARHHVAANLLMFGIIILGLISIRDDIALELLPDINLGTVTVTTVLPGGNPKSIESTITTRIEESIAAIEGIKNITSRSSEGFSTVIAEVESGYDEQIVLSDIKVQVDALSTLPEDAERPIIQLLEVPFQVTGLAIHSSSVSYDELYDISSSIRQGLIKAPGITKVSPLQAPLREFHIEVTPETLQKYNLTIEEIGAAIRRNSIDLSAGNLKTKDGEILIRMNAQAYTTDEFANIPVISRTDNSIYLRDIAKITDGYEETEVSLRFNREPAIFIDLYRTGKQSTLEVSDAIENYMQEHFKNLPEGVKHSRYADSSVVVKARLNLLTTNAIQGGILVLLLLSLFLRPAVAVWVGIGIPICFLGAFAVMPYLGLTLNMFTMFAFILVLGIVVDDALVTGENIYRHIRNGMPPDQAAIFGTKEVAVPVTFGVITTMIAFTPMLMVTGPISTLIEQIPLVIIPVLFFSLVESKLILPAHMSSIKPQRQKDIHGLAKLQLKFSRGFENSVIKFYRPLLDRCVANKSITLACASAILVLTFSMVSTGWIKSSFFPAFEDDAIFMRLALSKSTGFSATKKQVAHIENVGFELKEKYRNPETGNSAIKDVASVAGVSPEADGSISIGNNYGFVVIQLFPSKERDKNFKISDFIDELRITIGDIPGAEKFDISANFADFGRPISISLFGDDFDLMSQKVSLIREQLNTYDGVFDIQDNYTSGKDELQLELTPLAKALDISLAELTTQVRQAVYGLEAQRILRGHDEMRVMVHYPLEYRSSFTDIANLPIRIAGAENTVPLSQLAHFEPSQSPSAIYHDNRRRVITISANIDTINNDLGILRDDLKQFLDKLLIGVEGISYDMDGQAKAQREATESLGLGLILVILIIFSLLAIPFKSFAQPLIVMSIIPLSFVGAILGHIIMGEPISVLSLIGILALTGIVINDSLVLVDYINQQKKKGKETLEAVLIAGEVRFRPVILTSLTTFVGLLPLMFSSDPHSKGLIAMAISLGYGIIFATMITLIIIPVNYLIYDKACNYINSRKGNGQQNELPVT